MLWRDYGHLASVRTRSSIDPDGNPLPWYTYPAIDFLCQLNFADKTVFEFGAGMSTLFWARAARRVVSVEDDEQWFQTVSARAPANSRVILETDLVRYPEIIHQTGEQFDVIVVDGPARGRTRLKCCRAALRALREGGLIILDNSDWLPESARLLRESGLLQVDMNGFAPITAHLQTTSFYFHRGFNIPPLKARQPIPGRGHVDKNWEKAVEPVAGGLVEFAGEVFRGIADDRCFTLTSAAGPRRFRALTYLGFDDTRNIAIFDLDCNRVLLTRHRPATRKRREPEMDVEIARIAAMSWEQFTAFVAAHEYRRYRLTDNQRN